ncbi:MULTISPECIES: VOC family protein [unclassified Streptomyces]|uniref:VOC family protein n=1 Tax=unclassified Streptomyces TaxID=2593676 RepID=UPI002E1683BE|nr:VOC family protein [Streptomyces sp. NBC_01197]WSS52414.1 VOC family protein [Streptomyces sp. NBC_01180]
MGVPKTTVLVLDCSEHAELADFYAQLLGAEARMGADPDVMEVIGNDGVHLAVRKDHGYAPPSWPRPDDASQAHLRILVSQDDMDEAEREAIGLGARPLDTKNNGGRRDVRMYSDPAGHSFALVVSAPVR